MQSEEDVLTRIEQVAQEAGFIVAREPPAEYRDRAEGDLLVETPEGLLLFEARRKSSNARARVDVETRPKTDYRTRHLLLEKAGTNLGDCSVTRTYQSRTRWRASMRSAEWWRDSSLFDECRARAKPKIRTPRA